VKGALRALVLFAAGACGEAAARGPTSAEILWDRWGVPHVRAESQAAAWRALGWAQAEAHAELLLGLYAQARGRAAEYLGAEHLSSDLWVRTVGIPALAREWSAQQDAESLERLEAFCAGINAWGAEHESELDPLVRAVLPVEPADVLAHLLHAIHFTCLVDERAAGRESERLPARGEGAAGGSNAWAIAPERTEDGHALLLANPHLPWTDRFRFFEAQLVAPGLELYGASLVGLPAIVIGFNRALAWTHTLNAHDGADLFELEVEGESYRFGGELVPFETHEELVRVRRADGGLDERTLRVRRSVHGPLVRGPEDGRAFALRVVGLDRPGALRQWQAMGEARDLAEFEAALRRQQLPTFSVLYADRAGHVLHLFGGLVPVRTGGVSDTARPLPGGDPASLWTSVHGYDELPRVLDPASGWLQNSNDPPWTTTFPPALERERFPAYLSPRFMHLRAQRSARMLMEDERMSLDELVRAKHSTRVELADRLLDDLLPLARASDDPLVREAGAVLASWDRTVDAGSVGAVLFLLFAQAAGGGEDFFAEPWDETRPTETPRGIADRSRALAALASAARSLRERAGSLSVLWGEVFRLRSGAVDLPASGGMGELGIFRVFDFTPDADGRAHASGGDSFVAAVELGDPVQARVLNTYGNATRAGSPHRDDQLPLAARQELRRALLELDEIEAELEAREWVP
jgi:acyl-homoserine-lactone acylase